jgi:NTP pyrophosphatase (non-canonical NTP hydrolase)
MAKEIGDVMWNLAVLCHYFGLSLEDVAEMNIDKLTDRKVRSVIVGEGDNR